MNRVVISLLKIATILFIWLASMALTVAIVGSLLASHNSRALDALWKNDLKCGKPFCTTEVQDLPVPIQKDGSYDPDVSLYCMDLVLRVYNQARGLEPQPPKDLTEVIRLQDLENDPVFGIMWTYKSPDTGKKVAFVILRGTMDLREWAQDFTYSQESFVSKKATQQSAMGFLRGVHTPPSVHSGFLDAYNNFRGKLLKSIDSVKPDQIIVSGHSLGAGVATIAALDLKTLGYDTYAYVIASPRVGDNVLRETVISSRLPLFRVVNSSDLVPTLPPPVAPRFSDPGNPFIYTHCGELISFTDNWFSYFNNHLPPVYLEFLRLKKTGGN